MKKTAGETAERLAEYAVVHLGKCWTHGIKSFRSGSCWNLYKNFEYVLTFLWEYSIIVLIPSGAFHVL